MKSKKPDHPRLFNIHAEELNLSGPALLDLMRAVISRGVPFRFRARGWSMTPFIRDGDVITVSPLDNPSPGIGRVVAFIHPLKDKLVVHRVIARRNSSVLMQGDSVPEHSDGLVPEERLIGQVTRIERKNRSIWLGLGPERYLIAWLSRARLLIPLRSWLSNFRQSLLHRCF